MDITLSDRELREYESHVAKAYYEDYSKRMSSMTAVFRELVKHNPLLTDKVTAIMQDTMPHKEPMPLLEFFRMRP